MNVTMDKVLGIGAAGFVFVAALLCAGAYGFDLHQGADSNELSGAGPVSEGIQLLAELEKPMVVSGEKVVLKLTLKNVSQEQRAFAVSNPRMEFRLTVTDASGNGVSGNANRYGGSTYHDGWFELKPGEQVVEEYPVNSVFGNDIRKPGDYRITASTTTYSQPTTKRMAVSNTVTLTVVGKGAPVPSVSLVSQSTPELQAYDEWIHRYARPRDLWLGDGKVSLRLVITEVGDEKKDQAFGDSSWSRGCTVDVEGRVEHFSFNSMGWKGGSGPQIPAADFERLNQLLSALPDDGQRLPPAGRRVMVQLLENDQFRIRVYDRANASPQILEILRLSGSGIGSWVPRFEPTSTWSAYPPDGRNVGALCLSPDGRLIISSSMHGPLRFWNPDTRKLVKEIPTPDVPVTGITITPDGSAAVVQEWGAIDLLDTRTWKSFRRLTEPLVGRRQYSLSFPEFAADGRSLLLQSSEPALKVFDAKTWERRDALPGLPKDALAYVPARKANRAIYVSNDGTLFLWDTGGQRNVAKLDANVGLRQVAFSPDQSQVATVTVHGERYYDYRIRIWNANTGELVHELRTFEQTVWGMVEGLLWSPDGHYVLAATKQGPVWDNVGTEVWSAISGRHRGEFSGCMDSVTGLALIDNGRRLVAGCSDGKIRIWDAGRAFREIANYEKSYGRASLAPMAEHGG